MWRPRPTPPKRRVRRAVDLAEHVEDDRQVARRRCRCPCRATARPRRARPSRSRVDARRVPGGVNLSALPTRFLRIVFSFARSVRTGSAPSSLPPARARRRRCTSGLELAAELGEQRAAASTGASVDRLAARPRDGRGRASRSPARAARRALRWMRARVSLLARRCSGPNGALGEQVGVAGDDVERRAQLVRHGRDELGLEPARRLQVARSGARSRARWRWRARCRAQAALLRARTARSRSGGRTPRRAIDLAAAYDAGHTASSPCASAGPVPLACTAACSASVNSISSPGRNARRSGRSSIPSSSGAISDTVSASTPTCAPRRKAARRSSHTHAHPQWVPSASVAMAATRSIRSGSPRWAPSVSATRCRTAAMSASSSLMAEACVSSAVRTKAS